MKIKAIAFDIIETCFSLEPLRPAMARFGLIGEKLELLYAWSLRDGMALTMAGDYQPFKDVLRGTLGGMLQAHGQPTDDATVESILAPMSTLPHSSDLKPALSILHSAGIKIMALTNGSIQSTEGLLEHAGARDQFDHVLSSDTVKKVKPCAANYQQAVQAAGCSAGEVALVAGHGWDCHGAKRAGLAAGWVRRKEPRYPPYLTPVDAIGDDLPEVCQRLMAL